MLSKRREDAISALRYKDLLLCFVNSDLKSRHRDKVLGVLWTLLDPLLMMLIYMFIVMVVFKHRTPDFPIYLFTAIITWKYFVNCIHGGSVILINNQGLLKQVKFPRILIPLSKVLSATYEFFFSTIVLVFIYVGLGFSVDWHIIWIPLIFIIQLIMNVGVTMLSSTIGVFFRDLPNILTAALKFGWYLSPGMYLVSMIPQKYQVVYMLNPMAVLFTLYRDVTLYKKTPDMNNLLYVLLISIAMCLIGVVVFRKKENDFIKYL